LPPLTRRDFLALAGVGYIWPSELKRYPDPATDLDVGLLTNPAFTSGMSARHLRLFSRRSNWLLYWSERSGTRQAFVLDLESSQSKQLTDVTALDPAGLSFSPDDRNFYFFEGPSLYLAAVTNGKGREIYRTSDTAQRTGFAVASDGTVFVAERSAGASRILTLSKQNPRVIFESADEIQSIAARPRHTELFFRTADAVWLLNADGSGKLRVKTAPGEIADAAWTPSGRTLTYLHIPEDTRELITLREFNPEDNTDHLIASTSQFISAAANGDASVFTGASRSKASAYVLILLRSVKRDLTLCEHHASDPRMVEPVFSPDSQSVFFVSDRHGRPAVYRVRVERFVEQTLADESGSGK
jgi:Tol biopolymer transport system component